jgi:LysM repeat protein
MGIVLLNKLRHRRRWNSLRPQRVLSNLLLMVLATLLFTCKAQQRSTNVQVVNGKRFYIHKIEKKQSLYSISKLYNVNLDTIYKFNPELKKGAKAEQEIRIPVETPGTTMQAGATDTNKYLTHKVEKGETVYSISKKYKLTEKQLETFNPALSQGLKEGQVLIVGEKKRKKKDEKSTVPSPTVAIPALPVDSSNFIPFSKPTKPVYNLALLLPFKLNTSSELDVSALLRTNTDFPRVPALSTDFFLGCKKAVDSLSSAGFSINLQLYDVDENDSADVSRLPNDPDFSKADLIIGPLYSTTYRILSEKVRNMHTPIVSPFMPQNKILFNNIYTSKTKPSQYTLLENLADYCIDSLMKPGTNFVLMTVSVKDKKEGDYTEAFKAYFNQKVAALGRPQTDTIKTARGLDGLKQVFSPDNKNVVIALSKNQVFIADFTTQLAVFSSGQDVVLCGWEDAIEMDNIDQEYLNQLHYTFPHEYDISKRGIRALDGYYFHQQSTTPTEYYYIGFDVAYYYLKNLKEKGPDFIHRLDQHPMEASYSRFKFTRPDATTGFDNRGMYIFTYKEYQLHKTGWK